MSPVNGIRFGALVLDQSVDRSGSSRHGESWKGVWQHVCVDLYTELKELERLTDADIVVSAPDKQQHTLTITNKETGKAIPIVGVNGRPLELDIFEFRFKNRHSGELLNEEPLLVHAEEKYSELRKLVLNYALKASRPLNDNWPMGNAIKQLMAQTGHQGQISNSWSHVKSTQEHFSDTWFNVWSGRPLSSLPFHPYQSSQRPTALSEQVKAQATPEDWLQYFWQAIPEWARKETWKKQIEWFMQ